MIPTVGRIVHYNPPFDKDGPRAAIITWVRLHNEFYEGQPPANSEENTYKVSLHVFYTSGQVDMLEVPWSAKPEGDHWNWPPKA